MLLRVRHYTLLAVVLNLSGCSGGSATAEFQGTPPTVPATYEPTARKKGPSQAKPTKPDTHMGGADTYPCTGHLACSLSSPQDGTLKLASAVPHSIDPGFASDTAGQLAVENLFEGLIVPGMRSGPPKPGVAERWNVSDDGRVYTFHLRSDARWSNGRTVTAEDFRYSWTRALQPETASGTASVFLHIKGAKAFNQGENKDVSSVGIEALDERTLRVTLENPLPYFLEYVRQIHYSPVPREAVEQHGKGWTRPENIVSNGPYQLKEWIHRDKLVFEKNPTYWAHTSVRIPRVQVKLGGTKAASWTSYQGQTQHVVMDVPANLVSKFLEEGRPDFFIDNTNCYVDLAFNLAREPFRDRRIRQAMALAIDKERLVEHILGGLRSVAGGPVPDGFDESMKFPGKEGLPFDPEKARTLLAAAGYPNGQDLPLVTLSHNTSPNHVQVATFVQRTLLENLGVKLELRALEPKALFASLRNRDFQMARYARCATNHPYAFLEEFSTDSQHNHYGYKNASFDELLEASMKTDNESRRMETLALAERHLQKDLPNIPLFFGARSYLKVPVLRGWGPESGNSHLIKYMYWGDKEYEKP